MNLKPTERLHLQLVILGTLADYPAGASAATVGVRLGIGERRVRGILIALRNAGAVHYRRGVWSTLNAVQKREEVDNAKS